MIPSDEDLAELKAQRKPFIPKHFVDKAFPADGRSLYFDPDNPPKGLICNLYFKTMYLLVWCTGCIPSHSLVWMRLCKGKLSTYDVFKYFDVLIFKAKL